MAFVKEAKISKKKKKYFIKSNVWLGTNKKKKKKRFKVK